MKLKTLTLTLAAAALALGSTGFAQTNIVNITGATAFRTATLDAIKNRFTNAGAVLKMAHDSSGSFNAANLAIFEGTFNGIPGTTIVRCSFNGSVEGIDALVNSPTADPSYLATNTLSSVTAIAGGNNVGNGVSNVATPIETAQSHIAFSDVSRAATPFKNASLQPAGSASIAGVVTFTMVGNNSFPSNSVTSISAQNFRAMLANDGIAMSQVTGLTNDATNRVYATGRNDGSGTRTTYMAETGHGITTTVRQFIVGSINGATTNITRIYKVPAGGTNAALTSAGNTGLSVSNASTIWGQNLAGNGGYASGSSLRSDLGRSSTNVVIYDADGTVLRTNNIALVSWLSTSDARAARTNALGAAILGYNGIRLDGLATNGAISAADTNKIVRGAYTAWSFQQMYRRSDLTATNQPPVFVYNQIKNVLNTANLQNTGIPISVMTVVTRPTDGGIVAP
jgi:hypothetical protein